MDDQCPPDASKYAVLVGIDAYPERPLAGCVRDVKNMKDHLLGLSTPNRIHIELLVASIATDDPGEHNMNAWPTYNNVTTAIRNVTSQAHPGESHIYIHFAGHGTRKPPIGEFSNKSTGDLALVLLDESNPSQVDYLWGPEFAILLDAIVRKNVGLTVVLDCCFSGSVYRDDDSHPRFISYHPSSDSGVPILGVGGNSMRSGEATVYSSSRGASASSSWLLNPTGYAILAACGPHDDSAEVRLEEGDDKTYGALSYFLLQILKECGLGFGIGMDIIDGYLRATFRKHRLSHTPILYGRKTQGVFGRRIDVGIPATAIPIVEDVDGRLELQAGKAHGVSMGDVFALRWIGEFARTPGADVGNGHLLTVVCGLRAVTSNLMLSEHDTSEDTKTGWFAVPTTQARLQEFPIRISSHFLQTHRQEWLRNFNERSLRSASEQERYTFSIADENGIYVATDEFGAKIPNTMTISQTAANISRVCDMVHHLVKFKMVSEHRNPEISSNTFQQSFDVQIKRQDGTVFSPGCHFEVKHSEMEPTFELMVRNRGKIPLYVSVLDLGPLWEVENIYFATFEVLPPENADTRFLGTLRRNLSSAIPLVMRQNGHCQCEDIIKVFITSRPTSFDCLELPELGESAGTKSLNRVDHEAPASEEWATVNFAIRTVL